MLNVKCSTNTYSEKIEKIEKTKLCGQRSESEQRNGEKKSIFFSHFCKKTKAKISGVYTFEHYPKKYCSDFRFTFHSQNVLQKEMKMQVRSNERFLQTYRIPMLMSGNQNED